MSVFSLLSHDMCALSKETQSIKTKVLKVKCSKKKKKNIVHYCVLALDKKKKTNTKIAI